jgi:hypothetical protein
MLWSACILLVSIVGCNSPRNAKLNVSYRLAEVVDGDSVFLVSINGKKFEHKSSSGALEFFENSNRTALRVRVTSGRGTFASVGVDHYYCVDTQGRITYLGYLKSSWYEDEESIGFELGGFRPVGKVPLSNSTLTPAR